MEGWLPLYPGSISIVLFAVGERVATVRIVTNVSFGAIKNELLQKSMRHNQGKGRAYCQDFAGQVYKSNNFHEDKIIFQEIMKD